jgi:hypothetical protein
MTLVSPKAGGKHELDLFYFKNLSIITFSCRERQTKRLMRYVVGIIKG